MRHACMRSSIFHVPLCDQVATPTLIGNGNGKDAEAYSCSLKELFIFQERLRGHKSCGVAFVSS